MIKHSRLNSLLFVTLIHTCYGANTYSTDNFYNYDAQHIQHIVKFNDYAKDGTINTIFDNLINKANSGLKSLNKIINNDSNNILKIVVLTSLLTIVLLRAFNTIIMMTMLGLGGYYYFVNFYKNP